MFDPTLSHPTLALARTKVRDRDLLAEAEDYRLLKKARANQLSPQDRLLLNVGDGLISLGRKLKARHQPDSATPVLRMG